MSWSKRRWAVPKALPTWVVQYEVWRDGQPYRTGTMRIPAKTEQEARQAVDTVLRDLMSKLFPEAEIPLVSALSREAE